MPRDISLAEVILTAARADAEGRHTAVPGIVESYNVTTNTANVKVAVKKPLMDENGRTVYEELPVLPDVPVCFPRSGGYYLAMPLEAGDSVLLVFSEVSMGEWRSSGEVGEPKDVRRHSVGYPVAIPGLFPDTNPMGDVSARTAGLVVGPDGGSTQVRITETGIKLGSSAVDFVALSIPTAANFAALAAVVGGIATFLTTHTHPVPAHEHISAAPGNPTTSAPPATPLTQTSASVTTPPGALGAMAPVAATLVKAI